MPRQSADYYRQWRKDHPGYYSAVKKGQRARNPAGVAASTKKWTATNRLKVNAQAKAQRAVNRGALKREPCIVCGDPKTQAHHSDYSKPLDVTWVCNLHHKMYHQKLTV